MPAPSIPMPNIQVHSWLHSLEPGLWWRLSEGRHIRHRPNCTRNMVFPIPCSAALTGLPRHKFARYMGENWHAKIIKGPVIRIAPNEVAISDPSSIKEIYGVSSRFNKVGLAGHYIPSAVLICRGRPTSTLHGDPNLVRIPCYIRMRRGLIAFSKLAFPIILRPQTRISTKNGERLSIISTQWVVL